MQATVQCTNKGDPAPEDTITPQQTKLQGDSKPAISNGSNCTTSTPLTKKAATARRLELLEKKRWVELHTCLYTLDDGHGARLNTTKTKVVP